MVHYFVMQIRLFTIPIFNTQEANEELNVFLRSHQILNIEKHFSERGSGQFWCFCVTYLENTYKQELKGRSKKPDYIKILDTATFSIFSKFREIRKQLAVKHAVSTYIVFTDAELAQMAKLEDLNLNTIQKIKGVGQNKAEKYGKELIKIYKETEHEKSGQSDKQNS